MKTLKSAILPGLISGIFLGLFLKGLEQATQIKVYTLLLNLDYVPIINQVRLPELAEFSVHLAISIFLSFILLLFIKKLRWPSDKIIQRVIIVSLFIGILLYPSTALSDRTPPLSSLSALSFWLMGHILYGWLLGFMLRRYE